jgi:serine protease Do
MAGKFCPPLPVDKGSQWEYDLSVPCNASGFLLIPITWIPGKRLTPSPKSISLDGENVKLHQKNETKRRRGVSVVQVRTDQSSRWTRLLFAVSLLLLLGLLVLGAGTRPALAAPDASPFIDVSRIVRPSVVNIRITRSVTQAGVGTSPLQDMFDQFFPQEEGKGGRFEMPSTGSGFIVSDSGDILTNNHVIDQAEAIFVRFSGEKREYRATLVGTDPNTDLALISIDPRGRALEPLRFADSELVEVGSWAVAVGNPFGTLESSLTVGVVSAKGRGDLQIGGQSPRYQDFIQTDASINFGNSGGPLVDTQGRVIGINTAINAQGQGIGFAVPSNLVQSVYGQLKENGRVIRGYLGATTEDIVQIVGEETTGEPDQGARVLSILPDSPAAAGGLLPGDIIVDFAGQEVDSRRKLQFLVAGVAPGQEVGLAIIRNGQREELRVRPVEWIESEPGVSAREAELWLGLDVASLADGDPRVARLKEVLGVTAATGVMVVGVQEDQPAAEAGIRPGDVLISVDGHEITDLESYGQVRDLMATRRDPLSILLKTGGTESYVMVTPRVRGVEN